MINLSKNQIGVNGSVIADLGGTPSPGWNPRGPLRGRRSRELAAHGDSDGAPLGILTKSCNPPPSPASLRMERWALQSASRDILKGERVAICYRRPRPNVDAIDIHHTPKNDAYHYGGLMVCGSVWTCPVCASKITEKRRGELAQGVTKWQDQGGGVLLLTLTVPHYSHQSLSHVLTGITDARRRMLNRKSWKRMVGQIGIVGEIRAMEVTHGANGWHPHFHVLLFTRIPFTTSSLPSLELMILQQWQSACEAAGLPTPNRHGVSLEDGSKAASYASKWGLEHEMTKGHVKKGREGGRTPFDLLRAHLAGDPQAGALFSEYAKAYKGKRQLVWSSGLRDLLDLGGEVSDEELAEVHDQDAVLFASIPLDLWRVVLRKNRRGEVLEVCRQGTEVFHLYMIGLAEEAGLLDEKMSDTEGGERRWQTSNSLPG